MPRPQRWRRASALDSDDDGGFRHARAVTPLIEHGALRVLANAYDVYNGDYALTVAPLDGPVTGQEVSSA